MATQSATRGPAFYRGFDSFVMLEGEFDLHPPAPVSIVQQ
jgi:hypothetical protein